MLKTNFTISKIDEPMKSSPLRRSVGIDGLSVGFYEAMDICTLDSKKNLKHYKKVFQIA
jgi:hypothetical protein